MTDEEIKRAVQLQNEIAAATLQAIRDLVDVLGRQSAIDRQKLRGDYIALVRHRAVTEHSRVSRQTLLEWMKTL